MNKLLTTLLLGCCLSAQADQIEDAFTRKIPWFGKQEVLSVSFDSQSRTGFVLVELDHGSIESRFAVNQRASYQKMLNVFYCDKFDSSSQNSAIFHKIWVVTDGKLKQDVELFSIGLSKKNCKDFK